MEEDIAGKSPSPSPEQEDDGRVRTGTVWTTSLRIVSVVIGSGILSLPWAIAQLGWVLGPLALILLSSVTTYTSTLLSECYRSEDPVKGRRNNTYMDAVRSHLGGSMFRRCGFVQAVKLFGVAIGYTIASSKSTMAIQRSNCIPQSTGGTLCNVNSLPHIGCFGILQLILSQFHGFQDLRWLPVVAGSMSTIYSLIGLILSITKVISTGKVKGTQLGLNMGFMSKIEHVWRILQAIGNIAFAYSHPIVLIEIQDTIKSPPPEAETMKEANMISYAYTTLLYLLCGFFGYAAFGDSSPGNLLTGYGFHHPHWVLDMANIAIVIHLSVAYQGYCQTLFAFIEKEAAGRFPGSDFFTKEIEFRFPCWGNCKLNLFRTIGRMGFVMVTTFLSMLLPSFNSMVGLLGALGFWPLTVYFPVEMYIAQKRIPKWGISWICLRALNAACFLISIAAGIGSIAGVVSDLKSSKPFRN